MTEKEDIKESNSTSEEATNETESFVVLFDDEPTNAQSPEAEQPPATDESDGSFVVLFDDEAVTPSNGTDVSDPTDDSFVILFDDQDQTDQNVDLINFDDENRCNISLPPDMRLRHVSAIKSELEKALDSNEVIYDISRVKQLDTASVQLLYAHQNTLKDQDTNITWAGESVPFTSSAQALGFSFAD